MKTNLAKVSTTLILAMLMLGLIPLFPVKSSPVTTVYVTPSSISYESPPVGLGFEFNVSVWVDDVEDLCAYQVQITFDEAVVKCTDAFEPTWDSDYVLYSILPNTMTTEAYLPGSYTMGGSESPGKTPAHFNGTGLITIFEFEVTGVPDKMETIFSVLGIDNAQTFLLDGGGSQITIDSKDDGYVEITWKEPPHPYFEAPDIELNPMPYFTNLTGTSFTVDVDIMNYYAGWHMSNATFCLSYDTSLINASNVVLNTADWTGPNNVALSHDTLDWVNVTVRGFVGTQDGGATVPVATITFDVMYQGESPPMATGGFNETALAFCDETEIWDTLYTIHDPSVDGSVRIYAILAIPLPYFKVSPSYVELGPEPAIGQTFEVDIQVKNLYEAWHVVAFQLRIGYDDTLLEAVGATEGPFLTDPIWNLHGTIFAANLHLPPEPHAPEWNVGVGGFLLPNMSTGLWDQTIFPNTFDADDITLCTIEFKAIKQIYPQTLCCNLTIYPGSEHSPEYLLDVDMNWVSVNEAAIVHGEYCITTSLPGRMCDVYTQYPAPFGGQGPNQPSDMFWPQKEVELCCNVTYNWWPMQNKPVTFRVKDNTGTVWTVLQAFTDENGVACTSFRIPWPCEDPEQYFGVWLVIAEVDIACEVCRDELEFHYDWLMTDLKVTTDKTEYNHCEDVQITVTFNSHAQQVRTVAIRVTIHDELNVPIATTSLIFEIGGAKWCSAKGYVKRFTLHIEKFAVPGFATVYAVPLMLWKGHWISAGPQGTAVIVIQPY